MCVRRRAVRGPQRSTPTTGNSRSKSFVTQAEGGDTGQLRPHTGAGSCGMRRTNLTQLRWLEMRNPELA